MPILDDDPTLPPVCREDLPPQRAQAELDKLDREFVQPCTRCELHRLGRSQTVFGVGNPRPRLVFVGEGPGAEEDRQGIPFVGRAGQLLTKMIEAMTLRREEVYICNVVKCRPPGNRTPTPQEMEACSPYLFRQLAILRAEVIVALGTPAVQTLLATRASVGRLRGVVHHFPPAPLAHLGLPPAKLVATYHPAYLLRNPNAKKDAWEDLKLAMRELGLEIPRRRRR